MDIMRSVHSRSAEINKYAMGLLTEEEPWTHRIRTLGRSSGFNSGLKLYSYSRCLGHVHMSMLVIQCRTRICDDRQKPVVTNVHRTPFRSPPAED